MKERLQLEMRDMKAKLEATDSDSRQHLEQQVTRLSSRMADYQSDSSTAAASLTLRIQALEDQNNKVKVLIGSTYLYLKQPKLNECSLELCLVFMHSLFSCSWPRSCHPSRWCLLQPPALILPTHLYTITSHLSSNMPWRSGSLTASR